MKRNEQNNPQQDNRAKGKKRNKAWLAAGVIAGAGAIFAGWYFFLRKKDPVMDSDSPLTNEDSVVKINPQPSYSSGGGSTYSPPKPVESVFPLKKGSKGEKVRQLQNALIKKYGAGILPRYGADGDFGSEMEAALIAKGWPTQVDESTYNVITFSASGGGFNATTVGKQMRDALTNASLSSALAALKKIGSVDQYKKAGEAFKLSFPMGFAPATMTQLTLDTFNKSSEREQIRKELLRIGLKFSEGKWTLSGLELPKSLITLHDTAVWEYPNKRILVKANVLLGQALEHKNGYTLFLTSDGKRKLLVKTKAVKQV